MFQFPPLATLSLCIQPKVSWTLLHDGFPIRRSTGQRLYTAHRRLSQFYHVLLRLLVPRHPPNALTSLTTENVCSRSRSLTDLRARDAPADGQVITPHESEPGLGILTTHSPSPSTLVLRCLFYLSGSQCDVARSKFHKRRPISDRLCDLLTFRAATWMVRLLNRACTSFNYSVFK
jgi:hypothetical protein